MGKRKRFFAVFILIFILLLSACNKAESIICNNCSASNSTENQYCANCGTAFFQSESPSTTPSTNKESSNNSNELLGIWRTNVNSPASADILIFNSDNTFYSVNLGNNIQFYDVHIISSGTYTINNIDKSITIIDNNGESFTEDYSATKDALTFSGINFFKESANSSVTQSFVGDWSAYGSNDKVLTIKQDGTFHLHNATFGDNFSSGTYTRSSNIKNAIDLYDPNGDYVYTMQQLCADLMIDENGTRFLYQKISN